MVEIFVAVLILSCWRLSSKVVRQRRKIRELKMACDALNDDVETLGATLRVQHQAMFRLASSLHGESAVRAAMEQAAKGGEN